MAATSQVKETPARLDPTASWTFLSNHAHVLVYVARHPEVRLREVASAVGITERAVQKIVSELERCGFITRRREGRCNRYAIHRERQLRHPIEAHRTLGDLLDLLSKPEPEDAAGAETPISSETPQ